MKTFKQLSVARKIRVMITLTTALALILTGSVLISAEVMISRQALTERVSVLAEVVSKHVTAAISFEDVGTAENLLRSMTAEPNIMLAEIYNVDETLFARFQANSATSIESPKYAQLFEQNQPYMFSYRFLHLVSDIKLAGEKIGFIYIQVSLSSLWNQILLFLVATVVIMTVVVFLAYMLSSYLQRRITSPIGRLLSGMEAISRDKNYALRIEEGDYDELGTIIHGFNGMIEQIEKRDKEILLKSDEVEKHAFYDALTELPNRRLLMNHLSKEIRRAVRFRSTGALIYLDLDHFKHINDSLGHTTGDGLLISVAERLQKVVRSTDIPARLGGDEFVVILPDLDSEYAINDALMVAESIRASISLPHTIDGRSLYTSPSIGITLFNRGNDEIGEIIKQADLAMYRAKEDGRNQVQFFATDMQLLAEKRLQIEEDLRAALESGCDQLQLYVQPQVSSENRVVGAEVLMRWNHPVKGMISPAEFIPVAETTGLIIPLGEWLLETSCDLLSSWHDSGIDLQLSVNISPNEFLHSGFTDRVNDCLSRHRINPEWLELEVTEGVLLRDIDEAVNVMETLQRTGIEFAVDDFGTGYSSLQYLKTLPISKLKIDQSFVRDITTDANDAAIVTTIIAMTRHLGLKVIAEGVEHHDELVFLQNKGCQMFQGFYFYKPMPIDEFEALLKAQHTTKSSSVINS